MLPHEIVNDWKSVNENFHDLDKRFVDLFRRSTEETEELRERLEKMDEVESAEESEEHYRLDQEYMRGYKEGYRDGYKEGGM